MSKKQRYMSSKHRTARNREYKLPCPVCRELLWYIADPKVFGLEIALVRPWPGDLTECDRCHTLLEYRGDDRNRLMLQIATKERVHLWNKLAQEGAREPSLPELIEYVKKYLQMPARAVAGHRFRRSGDKIPPGLDPK